MATVAVIGAGIAGVSCAQQLVERGVRVVLLDRGIRLGGRLASVTLRDEPWKGRGIDVGAAYPTARDDAFAALMRSWIERGLAREWTDALHVHDSSGLQDGRPGPMRYAALQGLRSLVEDIADSLPDALLSVNNPVDVQRVTPTAQGVDIDGNPFDAVVLAMPDPQAKRILDPAFTSSHAALRGVAWEAALAHVALYEHRAWPEVAGVFVNDNPTLTWIADEGSRRGDGAPILVSHSTSSFAQDHLEHPERAESALRAAVHEVLGIDAEPTWTQVKRWTYARPLAGRSEPFHLDPVTRVGLCGDAWHGGPRIESAWLSGRALGAALAEALPSGQ